MSETETAMGTLTVRVPPDVRTRLDGMAARISARDLNRVTAGDIVRMCVARGLPMIEREQDMLDRLDQGATEVGT